MFCFNSGPDLDGGTGTAHHSAWLIFAQEASVSYILVLANWQSWLPLHFMDIF